MTIRAGERIRWASKFFTGGRTIASLTPSSRWLAKGMCRDIDPERPQTILELGAGMGPVTHCIQRVMHPESRIIAVEIDPDLHRIASQRCPDVEVVLGSATDIDGILDSRDIESVDCFLSCLPTPSLPKEVNRCVLEVWSRRCRSGVFTQITQIPWWYQSMYQQAFHDVEFQLVARNLPPAGVYHCRTLREDYDSPERRYGK
jgi:phosphatidylethanolamine/phosphatidyl-N-methylethanolamine N-methyltransferase